MNRKWNEMSLEMRILLVITATTLVVVGVAFGSKMYSVRNLQSMAFQIPEFGLLALAMMLSNLIGGIDLSIISTANLVAICGAFMMNGSWVHGISGGALIGITCITSIVISCLIGYLNDMLVTKTSAPPLIATLGTMTLINGIGMALTGGKSIGGIEPGFATLGKATFLSIPSIFYLFIGISIILSILLDKYVWGRKIYLLGTNAVASRFSGNNNERLTISIFISTALLSGLAGLIILSRVNSAKVGYGDSYRLKTLIICVIGGIDPNGGKGKVVGVVLAILFMQVMSSAFTILSLSPYTKKMIWGIMLILVLGLNHTLRTYQTNKLLKESKKELS